MKTYDVTLHYVEHPGFEIPPGMRRFEVEGHDLMDAVREADRKLHERHVTAYHDDFTVFNCNPEETACQLSVGDSERGWQVNYQIIELTTVN